MDAGGHTWIDDPDGFQALCRALESETEIALDTEADGFHHYTPKLCLMQISSRRHTWLVDTLALPTLEPLQGPFSRRDIRKVMHAAEQDLMFLRRDHGVRVVGLFDTSIAAQLLGRTHLGLATLLHAELGVTLSKTSQLDDWSVRPLSPAQITYAVADTWHLLALAEILARGLEASGRSSWAEEEFLALEAREWPVGPAGDPALLNRVKGWQGLPPAGKGILRQLLLARDAEAKRRDRPPFRIAPNPLLLDLAARPPASEAELRGRKGMPRHGGGALATLLFEAVRAAAAAGEGPFPVDMGRRRGAPLPSRDPQAEVLRDRLRGWRRAKGAALGLEDGVILPQRELDILVEWSSGLPAPAGPPQGVRAWRWREFGAEWSALLRPRAHPPADARGS
jgi:ribonuclease D